ncbi:hypothetical protein ASG25_20660 [Rhizobium sp. Leaf384]|nr:hypothetical protein ASG25_20660 [Rhizobium sp. Leaf384]
MSKAKITNECIKQQRAGLVPKLVAGPVMPSSRPDFLSVGRVVIDGRSWHITGTRTTALKHAFSQHGPLPVERSIP